MKTDRRIAWQLRIVSWSAFGLAWLVILGYITMLIANIRATPPTATGPQSPISAILRALALPGLPPSPSADGLLLLLMCGVFVLALRTSPALLRPKPSAAPAPAIAPTVAPEAPSFQAPLAAPLPAATQATELPRIFVSHSSGDNAFGKALVDRLRASGFDVWYDSQGGPGAEGTWEGGIPPATYWQDEIARELTTRPIFLAILTPQSAASKWVHDEIGLAWTQKNSANITQGKIVVPVLRQTCAINPWLTLVQFVDYRAEVDAEAAFEKLLIALRHGSTIPAPPVEVGPPFDIAALPGIERFIGREDDATTVMKLLTSTGADSGIAGIASTNGLAGIGKTALATEVIRRLMGANAFPDGIAVVVARDEHDPVRLLKQVLARFSEGRREPGEDTLATLADRARQILAGNQALVVLDNVEPGAHVGEVVQPLRAAGAAVLLTSRAELPAVPREARM
ncbi:MAG TPA: TIR domain-containing protein, partial [Ktedonobacterales bacterium]